MASEAKGGKRRLTEDLWTPKAEASEPVQRPVATTEERLRLRLHRATAKGFAGFGGEVSLDFDPAVTILQGENASCKSAWLEVIRYGLGIVRAAASRRAHIEADGTTLVPEIKITLLGDDREVLVSRKGDGSPEVRERFGENWRVVPRPVEWLRDLIDVQAAGPHLFVDAKDDDRATMLLEALDLPSYSRSAALQAAGLGGTFRLPNIPQGLHPLEDIERVYQAVYDSRTAINSKAKAEADAADHLLSGLPAEPPQDASDQVAQLEAQAAGISGEIAKAEAVAAGEEKRAIEAADASLREYTATSKGIFQSDAAKLRAAFEKRKAEILAAAEREIATLKAATNEQVEVFRVKGEQGIDAAEEQAELQRAAARELRDNARTLTEAKRADLAKLSERLATLRAQQEAIATDRHVRATAHEGKERAQALEARSDQLTAALKGLRRYATELAGTLPIRGLEVRYDEKGRRVVTLDKIPLDQVNSGRLRELGSEVSMLQLKARGTERARLPLVLVDWFEQVDADRRAEHLRGLTAGGAQVVAAVVDVGPMRALRGVAIAGKVA